MASPSSVPLHHAAPELDPRDTSPYPTSHASVHEHPLARKSVPELRRLLDEKKVDYRGIVDKVQCESALFVHIRKVLSWANSKINRMTLFKSASNLASRRSSSAGADNSVS